jgi:hypothetical protein
MKKTILIILAFSLLSAVDYAQEFYLRGGLGYAFPQAGQTVFNTPIPYYEFPSAYSGSRNFNTSGAQTYNIKSSSFSSGVQMVLGLGYMFTKNIGIQLDGGIGVSPAKSTFNDENVPVSFVGGGTVNYDITTTQRAKTPFFLMPSLVLQTGGDKLNAYTRFGIALPLNTKITQEQTFTNAPGTGAIVVDDFTWQIKNSFSLGFTAAAGVKYKLNDAVSIWGELSLLSMSVYTKEQDLTQWTESGIGSVPLSQYGSPQNIKFSKTATVDTNYASFPTYAQPFSNVGITVGVSVIISKHERHSGRSNNEDMDNTKKPFRRR